MTIYYQDDYVTLYHGDSREVLALEDIQADVLITDPPYAVKKNGEMLGFVSPNWHKKETHSIREGRGRLHLEHGCCSGLCCLEWAHD